jgi:hypothetical protein
VGKKSVVSFAVLRLGRQAVVTLFPDLTCLNPTNPLPGNKLLCLKNYLAFLDAHK